MLKSPLLAGAAVLQTLLQCGGSGGAIAGGASAAPKLHTESYLAQAIDSQNLFRWTPRVARAPVDLNVVLRNAPAQLPAGFDALGLGSAEIEAISTRALSTWLDVLPESFELQIHAYGAATSPPDGSCTLEVRFVEVPAGQPLSGYAWLETPLFDPRTVTGVHVEISVPPDLVPLASGTLEALLLHEFGHALGIVAPQPHTGHSPSMMDVMHPQVRWTRLSAQDRLAIAELYAMEPNILRGDAVGGPGAPGGGSGAGDGSDGLFDPLRAVTSRFGAVPRYAPPRMAASGSSPGCRDCH